MIEPLTLRAGPALAAASLTATATPLLLLFLAAQFGPEPASGEWLIALGVIAIVGAPLAALFAGPILWLLRRGLLLGCNPIVLGLLGAGAALAYLASGLLGFRLEQSSFASLTLPLWPAMAALRALDPAAWTDGGASGPAAAILLTGIPLGGFLGGLVFAGLAREPRT